MLRIDTNCTTSMKQTLGKSKTMVSTYTKATITNGFMLGKGEHGAGLSEVLGGWRVLPSMSRFAAPPGLSARS